MRRPGSNRERCRLGSRIAAPPITPSARPSSATRFKSAAKHLRWSANSGRPGTAWPTEPTIAGFVFARSRPHRVSLTRSLARLDDHCDDDVHLALVHLQIRGQPRAVKDLVGARRPRPPPLPARRIVKMLCGSIIGSGAAPAASALPTAARTEAAMVERKNSRSVIGRQERPSPGPSSAATVAPRYKSGVAPPPAVVASRTIHENRLASRLAAPLGFRLFL